MCWGWFWEEGRDKGEREQDRERMGMVARDGDGAGIRFWVSGASEADASEEEREIKGQGLLSEPGALNRF